MAGVAGAASSARSSNRSSRPVTGWSLRTRRATGTPTPASWAGGGGPSWSSWRHWTRPAHEAGVGIPMARRVDRDDPMTDRGERLDERAELAAPTAPAMHQVHDRTLAPHLGDNFTTARDRQPHDVGRVRPE